MSEARTHIFQRLRAVPRPEVDTTGRDYVPIYDWDRAERIKRFTERMQAVRAEVHHSDRDSWLNLLADLCKAKGLTNLLVSPHTEWGQAIYQQVGEFPTLQDYDRAIEAWKHEMFYNIDASLTSTVGGIAETGSLILWPTEQEPRIMSLVPPVHFAILDTQHLYTTFAEAMQEQDWLNQGMPTNALLISGPSKSADIAQVLAYGVHGPKELVVILI
ncbi:LutC/YkgG family protein [Thiofilum flexile]|uniref:LutC/YkgG family protein n=1 Tax=Thiofilum flexile TaxID=125627 RepID=UPI0003717FF7|nr:lactate utilization protein [Thiofilum flexile]